MNDTSQRATGGDFGFLTGGGELGELIRNFDWGATSLGSPATWPQNLRMALRIMLTSRQPMWIGWGADLIYFYNDPYQSIIGGKHPWALGRPTSEVWREIWTDISPLLDTALRGDQGTFVESQLLIMERNGYPEETYYTFSYSPIPNEDGSVGGIICANSDDTRRVVGERQLALLRDLATTTAQAQGRTRVEICTSAAAKLGSDAHDVPFALVYLPDETGTTLELEATFGIDPEHPAIPPLLSIVAGSSDSLAEALRSQPLPIVSDLSAHGQLHLPWGPWPRAPDTVVLLPIGETSRAGALIVGLNPFRLYDAAYESFLQLVAGQIAAALANAQAYEEERRRAEALAEVDRAKTQFFSNVSHEFRTPLTLMVGPLEDALNDQSNPLPSSQHDRIQTAQRNSVRLLKLVNTLLDFSRIEAGRVEANLKPTDLSAYTAELASTFQSAVEKASLTLTIRCPRLPDVVYVDPEMWEKIVLNLLSNAFKFTFQGEISVETRLSRDGRSAELIVRDTGVGIPEHDLPRLFERFHRVEGQKSRSFEGSGIGLALVQELTRLHGGEISVESAVGRGTTFTVSLPLGIAQMSSNPLTAAPQIAASTRAGAYVQEALRWLPESAASADVERRAESVDVPTVRTRAARVLIADDNADMRSYLSRLLGERWEVATAANGDAALQSIRQRKPDLVLSDVMMPELDGFGLLRELRADPQLRSLPVILLSARAGEDARVEGLDAGADDYLTKPFSARELIARVNTNLELARVRREATRELQESESRFRNMAENAPVMMWMTDDSGAIVYVNRRWTEFTGQTLEAAVGPGAREMIAPEDRGRTHAAFLAAHRAREPFRMEYRLRHRDGGYRWALSAASARVADDGKLLGYIGSVIDISDQKEAERILREANELLEQRVAAAIAERAEAEAQLRQSQKMEAVGRLTGGIAHDFNNVLQVIAGNLQLLTRDVSGNLRGEHRLSTAIAAVDRGSKLASQLLAFGRRQPLAPKVINLGRLIRGTGDMLRRALGEAIEIETIIAGGLWNTFVDAAQVENALLNLAINARDAMQGVGKLTIEAGNAFLDDTYATRHAEVAPGQYVMVAVTDTGGGIPAELLERVVEPFFTTKPEGKGTGLGLSMVYGFVKQSGGHLKIYSEVGQGTTVRIYLPRSRHSEDVETIVEMGAVSGGTEVVLVVEDDEEVRATVVDMLTDLGYSVLKARDAQSALAIVESGAPIDLLFTDVVMPGPLRSPELAIKARERIPTIAVLFTSGYTENAIVHGGRLDDGIELLSKPYHRDALARKIRHVLRNQQQRNAARSSLGRRKPDRPAPRAAARILLVEDDADIRFCTTAMLQDMGHSVTEAGDAAEAIVHLGAEEFDVLVTDLSMPGMTGSELAVQALARHPSLRVVFASGYAPDETSLRMANATYLRKPYDTVALGTALASVMAW